jgi:hypothetical protein
VVGAEEEFGERASGLADFGETALRPGFQVVGGMPDRLGASCCMVIMLAACS